MQAERQRQDAAWQLPAAATGTATAATSTAVTSTAALIRNSSPQNAQQQKPNLR